MNNERLEQIKDSVDFRLSAEKHLKVDKEVILEEKELLEYITFLQNECKSDGKIIKYLQKRINKAIELLNNWDYLDKIDCYYEPTEIKNILEGKDE